MKSQPVVRRLVSVGAIAAGLVALPSLASAQNWDSPRSWLLCGGGYPGWTQADPTAPALCGAVQLEVTGVNGLAATLSLKVQNLSGLFNSYAGSVFTGIGLSNIFGGSPSSLTSVTGPCLPSDKNCAAQWAMVTGKHSTLPNGVGAVDYKFYTKGLLGGIASTCGGPNATGTGTITPPANPGGLFTTSCFSSTSYVTFTFTTHTPVDLRNAYISLRAQNGYNGSSTACITDDPAHVNNTNTCYENTTVTPEPGTLILMGSGLGGMMFVVGRRRKRQDAASDDIIT